MKDTEFECIEHGWRSHYQVCPFCMILVLQDDITKLKGKLQAAESLAASRLADQEAIERHARRVVAGEICEYLCKEWPFMGAGAVMDIKERYGVE